MAKQNKPTSDANANSAAGRKQKKPRATRATAKAAKITSKSRKTDKANAPVVTAIIRRADHDKQQKEHRAAVEDELLGKVNWQWRTFALGLMNGLNNYKAYAEAYDMNDVDRNEKSYRLAAVLSSQLLKNPNFRAYWRELIIEQGFNDDVVDTEMVKLITDPTTPAAVRRATLRDYNELQGRIVKKNSFTDDKGISLFDPENTAFEIRIVKAEK